MKKPILIGTKVVFDSEHGIQTGTVSDIKSDLGNGQAIALVTVPGTQSNAPWHMPVAELQRAA